MTSQERFWQARLMAKETEHKAELSAIHKQLEALKATTEDAKAACTSDCDDTPLPDLPVTHQYVSIE